MSTLTEYSGWLNVYKPTNISSAAVVASIKKILGGDVKVGHCGTLDPLAEGILPIAIGEATKLSSYLVGSCKTYSFTIKFGVSTTTGDAEGAIKETCSFIPNSVESLQAVVFKFLGKTQQRTPNYAATKVGGKPFYKLARQGLEVPEHIRDINIFSLQLIDHDLKNAMASYQVSCSKGTYVRTLAEDIASSLQSLGFVIELIRIAVKNFSVVNSLTGSALLTLSSKDALDQIKNSLLPVEYILDDIPVFDISIGDAIKVKHGKKILIFHDDLELLWLRFQGRLISIGGLSNNIYNIFCNFNLIEDFNDVDCTRA